MQRRNQGGSVFCLSRCDYMASLSSSLLMHLLWTCLVPWRRSKVSPWASAIDLLVLSEPLGTVVGILWSNTGNNQLHRTTGKRPPEAMPTAATFSPCLLLPGDHFSCRSHLQARALCLQTGSEVCWQRDKNKLWGQDHDHLWVPTNMQGLKK